jgi:hypothetical protein
VNAFAAIASAVEISKRVLHLEDERGRIIGRKLIGITAQGQLFGFRSYGAACLDDLDTPERPHVWIKVLFDLAKVCPLPALPVAQRHRACAARKRG